MIISQKIWGEVGKININYERITRALCFVAATFCVVALVAFIVFIVVTNTKINVDEFAWNLSYIASSMAIMTAFTAIHTREISKLS